MKSLIAVALLSTAALAAPAMAGNIYMTGAGNPWGQTTNEQAMDAAFGAGNWTKLQGFTASAFTGNSFVFMDGGDSQATEFGNFVTANSAAFGSFLASGGHALVQVAPNQNDYTSYVLPEGLTIDGIHDYSYPTASSTASLTAAGLAAGLDQNGAGASWMGGYFAHSAVFGGNCLISGQGGCIFANAGNLWAGGETTTNFHYNGDPLQLRVNELKLASGNAAGAVPEPASWAMMIAGFGLVGAVMRRRATMLA